MPKNFEVLDRLNEEERMLDFPAHILKISYDPDNYYGQFVLVDKLTKEMVSLGKEIEFIPIVDYGRYSRFNPHLNNFDVLSNFFKSREAGKAIDKFSGRLIKELKSKDPDKSIKYKLYFFGYLLMDGDIVPACYILSRTSLRQFLEFREEKLKPLKKWRGYYAFKITRVKEGKGMIYFKPVFDLRELSDEELEKVANDVEDYLNSIKQYVDSINEAILAVTSDIEEEAIDEIGANINYSSDKKPKPKIEIEDEEDGGLIITKDADDEEYDDIPF